jgi:hypothetical protein
MKPVTDRIPQNKKIMTDTINSRSPTLINGFVVALMGIDLERQTARFWVDGGQGTVVHDVTVGDALSLGDELWRVDSLSFTDDDDDDDDFEAEVSLIEKNEEKKG